MCAEPLVLQRGYAPVPEARQRREHPRELGPDIGGEAFQALARLGR